MRSLISSGSSFEQAIGYSRAVVDGDWIFVSGTTGFDYETMTIADDVTGDVYVADSIRKIVQVFRKDQNYAYAGTFGAPGTMPVQMGGPFDIEVDDQFLYVADTPRNKIVVFDKATRAFVAEFGGAGTALGKETPENRDASRTGKDVIAALARADRTPKME